VRVPFRRTNEVGPIGLMGPNRTYGAGGGFSGALLHRLDGAGGVFVHLNNAVRPGGEALSKALTMGIHNATIKLSRQGQS
jgi:hypothetical protein